jgi:putative GTP pyrophosphokinase
LTEEITLRYQLRSSAVLEPLASRLESHLREQLEGVDRIDRIQTRAKAVDRFVAKSEKETDGIRKYSDPFSQIQDQIGARVIVFYLSDVEAVSQKISRYFRHIEKRDLIPESESEFGYFGLHYVLRIPTDILDPTWDKNLVPEFFELQIKTLFQHAWSEANHDLGYKSFNGELSSNDKRKMAWASAQAWGADQIFDELFSAPIGRDHGAQSTPQ